MPADAAAKLICATDIALGTDAAVKLAGALMRACWAEDRNISDADTLAAIVTECSLDAAAIAARADDGARAYDANTEEAVREQVFGAPWYVVDGVPFWGQDRLDFVERALAS